jgi:hypothetical protein
MTPGVRLGVLLITLGYLTVYAAPHSGRGASWAQMILRTGSVSAASLPSALFSLMGSPYFLYAPLFVLGAALTVVAVLVLITAAFSK